LFEGNVKNTVNSGAFFFRVEHRILTESANAARGDGVVDLADVAGLAEYYG